MNKYVLLLLAISLNNILIAQEFEKKPIWKETFSFKYKLNTGDWNVGTNLDSPNLNISYDNQLIRIRNGKLILKAIKYTNSLGEIKIKDTFINTLNKRSFKYGKLEIKAKFPIGKGVWPAIWLVKVNREDEYPKGEIDLFEYIDCWNNEKHQGNVHYIVSKSQRKMYEKFCKNDITQFHIYTLEWTPTEIRMKCDGNIYLSYKKDNPNGWTFDEEYFLILNLGYGGWGATCGIDYDVLPCQMEIDWIKYYKFKSDNR